MIHPSLLCAFGIATALLTAQAPISYSGPMTLPADLYATDGIRLEKGAYQVEVKLQKDGGSLAFLADYKVKAVVNGQTPRGDPAVMPAATPLMGALYLTCANRSRAAVQQDGTYTIRRGDEGMEGGAAIVSGVGWAGGVFCLSSERSARAMETGRFQAFFEADQIARAAGGAE